MIEIDDKRIEGVAKDIYHTAVGILAKHGVLVDEPFCRSRIMDSGKATCKDNRIYYAKDVIESMVPFGEASDFRFDYLEKTAFTRKAFREAEDKDKIAGFAFGVYDVEQKQVRDALAADLEEALKLCDVMGIGGHYPCAAMDVPPAIRNVFAHKMCLTRSRYNSTHVCLGKEQAQYIHPMYEALGEDAAMPISLTSVTPLRIETSNLEVIRYFLEKNVDKQSVHIFPIAYGLPGVNYPITLAGAWSLCFAEHLALYITAKLLDTGFEVAGSWGLTNFPAVDYANVCIADGSSLQHLHNTFNNILAHAVLGRDYREYEPAEIGLYTGSPSPDVQAGAEKMAAALYGLQRNRNVHFGWLGNLCLDDVFSMEQMLLDLEIIAYARNSVAAFDNYELHLDFESCQDDIEAFIKNGTDFLAADSTIKYLREVYHPLKHFEYKKLATYKDQSHDQLIKRVSERKRELLASYDYRVDEDVEKEINGIYKRAQDSLR